jgi:hypothetical protein
MLYKLSSLFRPIAPVSLSDVDSLYRDTISSFSTYDRIAYCQRLIQRAIFDLSEKTGTKDKEELQQLISAAEQEVHNLSKT